MRAELDHNANTPVGEADSRHTGEEAGEAGEAGEARQTYRGARHVPVI